MPGEREIKVAEALGAHTEAIGQLKAGQSLLFERVGGVEQGLAGVRATVDHMAPKVDQILAGVKKNGHSKPSAWPMDVMGWARLVAMIGIVAGGMVAGFQCITEPLDRIENLEQRMLKSNLTE